jgi:hypothetical protein
MKQRALIAVKEILVLAPTIFIIALNMCFVSWESTLARVKASKRGAKSYPRGKFRYLKYDVMYKN